MTDRFQEALILAKQGVLTRAYFHVYEEALQLAQETQALKAENEQLRKENEQLKAKLDKSKWQPIETAPKDGTRILVKAKYFEDDVPIYIAQNWRDTFGGSDEWKGESMVGSITLEPVEWMPLHDAPEQR